MNQYSLLMAGTTGGTILTILRVGWMEIEKTLVLGSIAAVVSFFVSLFLNSLIQRWKRKNQRSR